jgi:PAS domain S-box-containing protein
MIITKDKEGKPLYRDGFVRNVTQRKKAEEALKDSEKRFRIIIENSRDGINMLDLKTGKYVFMSPAQVKLTGFTAEEISNISSEEAYERTHPDDREITIAQQKRVAAGEDVSEPVEYRWKVKSGEYRWFSDSRKLVRDEQGQVTAMVGITRDITRRKKVEETLQQAQSKLQEYTTGLERLVEERTKQLKDSERLAAIGATAGMVGHDIRNPLQAITSDVYLVKTELASTPDSEEKKNALESLAEIEKNIEYINKIVQDLQDYARPLNPIAKETNLQTIVEGILKKNEVPDSIKVSVKLQKKATRIIVDPDIVKRIMANLVTNAIQAMPEGGKLDIRAIQEASDTVITVHDTGVGIPEEVRPKLFTPLFTTKSKGQGFGLAVVKRMTEAIGGTVTFESALGKGTKFIIRLPAPRK